MKGEKNMRQVFIIFIAVALMTVGTVSNNAKCGGIPVFDGSNLINQLKDYLQQMQQYSAVIDSNTLLGNQLSQAVQEYQQVLKEYQHYLARMKSVRHIIDNQDWARMMRLIKSYYGASKISGVIKNNPSSPGYEKNLNDSLKVYGHVPEDPNNVETESKALGIWTKDYQEQVNRDYQIYDLHKDRFRKASKNRKTSEDRVNGVLAKHTKILNQLGDEDDVATLQAIAAQNITMMNQTEHLIEVNNQILIHMESKQAQAAADSAMWRKKERDRLKNRQKTQLLGRDRWGKF